VKGKAIRTGTGETFTWIRIPCAGARHEVSDPAAQKKPRRAAGVGEGVSGWKLMVSVHAYPT
jgi:hypothetical protein